MSSPTQQVEASTLETAELTIERRPVPIWVLIVLFLLLYWGMLYFDLHGGWFKAEVYAPYRSLTEVAAWQPPPSDGIDLGKGKKVYEMVCGLCHNPDGMGKPNQAPPLAGSEWALGGTGRMIRIPLLGLTGPIEVKGQQWNLSMTAMGAALSDDDLAAVLTYIRKSWGNNASEITPEQVKAVRKELGANNQPTTADELKKLPDK
jgi:mono/diheme cytochrome c family protein